MKKILAIFAGKSIAVLSRIFNIGSGSTWPGHAALFIDPEIIQKLSARLKKGLIIVAGTNGKTTTAKMISQILKNEKFKVINNPEGANLLNGIGSSLITSSNWSGNLNDDFAIFEIDEATLPLVLEKVTPKIIILLNLFRDQLDRYGEVDLIAEKWTKALEKLPKSTNVLLNADDPEISQIGSKIKAKTYYFGLNNKDSFQEKIPHAVDSIFCPSCGHRLVYENTTLSHLGLWHCLNCSAKRPKTHLESWEYFPLDGVYNMYNTIASVLTAKIIGVDDKNITESLKSFKPAFGRQEEIEINGNKLKIILSKNPTGFNESIRTVLNSKRGNTLLIALNDRIPDGTDISWIWDVDLEKLSGTNRDIIVTGDRAYDMALRLKYADIPEGKIIIETNMRKAITSAIKMAQGKLIYILPTYSAMLEARSILLGRKLEL